MGPFVRNRNASLKSPDGVTRAASQRRDKQKKAYFRTRAHMNRRAFWSNAHPLARNWISIFRRQSCATIFFTPTRQKTLKKHIYWKYGNEMAGVKVGKCRERVHNFASTDQMEANNSANWPQHSWLSSHIMSLFKKVSKSRRKTRLLAAKYSSLFKGMLGVLWVIIMG